MLGDNHLIGVEAGLVLGIHCLLAIGIVIGREALSTHLIHLARGEGIGEGLIGYRHPIGYGGIAKSHIVELVGCILVHLAHEIGGGIGSTSPREDKFRAADLEHRIQREGAGAGIPEVIHHGGEALDFLKEPCEMLGNYLLIPYLIGIVGGHDSGELGGGSVGHEIPAFAHDVGIVLGIEGNGRLGAWIGYGGDEGATVICHHRILLVGRALNPLAFPMDDGRKG